MNNNFVQEGMPFTVASAKAIIPKLTKLAAACRKMKMPVIYTTQVYSADGSNIGLVTNLSDRRYPPKGEVAREGTTGVNIYHELEPAESDILIKKHRYSCFYQTDLESKLQLLGVDTLIITGVATDCCISLAAFDAFQRNFKVIVVNDCTAAYSKEAHQAELNTISRVVGEVTDCSTVISRLG